MLAVAESSPCDEARYEGTANVSCLPMPRALSGTGLPFRLGGSGLGGGGGWAVLGGSWVAINGVVIRVTILISHIRGSRLVREFVTVWHSMDVPNQIPVQARGI